MAYAWMLWKFDEKGERDKQFLDDDAVIPSATFFSYEPVPPEDMGFFAPGYKKLENGDERKKEVEKAIEEFTPSPLEKEVEDKKEEERIECELQLSPMDVDEVLVNGVELMNVEGSVLISRRRR